MQELNKKRGANTISATVYFYSVILSLLLLISCSSKDETGLSKEMFPGVEKVIARTTSISLSGRENHELSIDLKKYEATVVNYSTLYGKANQDTFFFNDIIAEAARLDKPVVMYLASKEYGLAPRPGVKESPDRYRVQLPHILDQDSRDAFIKADLLFGLYEGPASSVLEGIELKHANALLHFKVIGQDLEDKVMINDLTSDFLPFKVSQSEYYAIITGDWLKYERTSGYIMSLPEAYILINGDRRSIRVNLPKEIFPVKSGEKYGFNIRIDLMSGKAEIEGIVKSVWNDDVI